jgi:protein involved in polysaccharide export with SLBB domain
MDSKGLCLFLAFGAISVFQTADGQNSVNSQRSPRRAAALPHAIEKLDDKTQITAGDKLSFQISEDGEGPVSLVVSDSGRIQVPYIGPVLVVGGTPRQAAEKIQTALQASLYKHATVLIWLDKRSSQSPGRVFVNGEVNHQGSLDLHPAEHLTVSQAIVEAGGFSAFANQHKVKVVRKSAGAQRPIIVDVARIENDGRTDLDVRLEPDDIIFVPARIMSW